MKMSWQFRYRLTVYVCIFAVIGWFVFNQLPPTSAQVAPRPTATVTTIAARDKYRSDLVIGNQQESLRLIITLENRWGFESRTMARRSVEQRRNQVRQAQSDFVARNGARMQRVNGRTAVMPMVFVEATRAQIPLLAQDASVVWIQADEIATTSMNLSTELIGSREVNQSGFDGAGTSVAVLDDGTSNNHPFLSGQVVSEACFSTSYTSSTVNLAAVCPNGTDFQEGTGSAAPYGTWDHGNHVAGTVAGKVMTSDGRNIRGVAPGAKIIGVQVFSRNPADNSSGSLTSDQIRAFDWLYQNINTPSWGKLAAINMSLGGSVRYTAACDTDPLKVYIDQFRLDGVATVIASGNNGFSGVANPACISSAIVVGATTNGVSGDPATDVVAIFSNSPSPASNVPNARGDRLLDLFAPGTNIYSAGDSSGTFSTKDGTSMATPHVSGAFAVLRQMRPDATITQLLQMLYNTGKMVTDVNGLTAPRIDLKAVAVSIASVTPTAVPSKTAIPTPSVALGQIKGWGNTSENQVTPPSSGSDYRMVDGGLWYSLALKQDGTVVAWGRNTDGETTIPSGLSDVVDISAGYWHALVLKSDGTLVTWGFNDDGRLNIPMYASNNIVKISAGQYHNLALRSDGSVVGWGYNNDGEASVPSGLTDVVGISAGAQYSMALKSDGTVHVWGNDYYGVVSGIPASLTSGSPGVVQISAGDKHAVALKSDGTVVVWGDNTRGQTVIPSGLSDVVAIDARYDHTLALKSDGTVVAWGRNTSGQSTVPSTLGSIRQISTGGYHSLALSGTLPTLTPTKTRTATNTATVTTTRSPTRTATNTATRTATRTATNTATRTVTRTATRTATIPSTPAAFVKVAPANSSTSRPLTLTLSWGSSRGATSYEYCIALSATTCTTWKSNGTKLSVTVQNLQRNKTYFWQVRAKNSAGITLASGGIWKFTTIR